MRKVNLVCVGKIKESYLADAIKEYSKRLQKYCDLTITEVPDSKITETAVKTESDLILKALYGSVILFDLKGVNVSSEEFSVLIDKEFVVSPVVTFVIGGSHGVGERIRAAAKQKISFGRVTYPHQLMRVISLEQIYRAFNILENTPYHK